MQTSDGNSQDDSLRRVSEMAKQPAEWPKITIVTPSYNQGQYIEATIRLVLCQDYPKREYIVTDGRSADNSVEIF